MICQTTGAAIATRSQWFRPQARQHAGKQTGVEGKVCGKQNHEENVNRAGHTAKLRDTDVNPVDA